MSFDYPVRMRIRTKTEFDFVFSARQRMFEPLCLLQYNKNNMPYPRLGVIISRRNIPKAVHRNRIKRLIRECFRLKKNKLASIDFVFIAKKGLEKKNNDELKKCIERFFLRCIE